MAGYPRDIMIIRVTVSRIAAFRLQGNKRVANGECRKLKCAILNKRIISNRAPDILQICLQRFW